MAMLASELMRSNFLSVHLDDSLHSALSKLDRGKHHSAIVLDNRDRFVGLLDKESCLRSRGDLGEMKVRKVVRKTSRLEETMELQRVARLLLASDVHILPVLDKYKRVAGIVGARDLILAMSESLRSLKVSDVMVKFPLVVSSGDNIAKVIELMRRQRISRVPVVDAKKKLVGVATLFDILKRMSSIPVKGRSRGIGGSNAQYRNDRKRGSSMGEVTIDIIMERKVQTASSGLQLQAAVRKMSESGISDLIIIDEGRPIGIVTSKDILKRLA